MEGAFGVEDMLRDLPQVGRDWLEGWAKPAAMQPSFLELCVTLQVQESRLMPQWLNERSTESRKALWYPMHLEAAMCAGRVHNGMYYLAKALREAGIEARDFVEERFCFTATEAGTVVLAESALLDDDSLIFSRLEMPADKSQEGWQRMVRVNAGDMGRVLQSGSMDAFPSCSFCSARREICMCRLERGPPFPEPKNETATETAPETATETDAQAAAQPTALDFWEGMKGAIASNFVFTCPQIRERLRGPTPSLDDERLAPRLLQFTFVDPSTSLPGLLEEHFAAMARQRRHGTALRLEWKLATRAPPASRRSDTRQAASYQEESDADRVRATCTLCGEAFPRKGDLDEHLLAAHKGVKAYQCSVCRKRFSASRHLATHVATVHERRRSAACPWCNDLFSTMHKMQLHVRRVHLHERPYSCERCDYSCFQRSDLNRHVKRTHWNVARRLDASLDERSHDPWSEFWGLGLDQVDQRADGLDDCAEESQVGTSDLT